MDIPDIDRCRQDSTLTLGAGKWRVIRREAAYAALPIGHAV
jgi:hypothetical protein